MHLGNEIPQQRTIPELIETIFRFVLITESSTSVDVFNEAIFQSTNLGESSSLDEYSEMWSMLATLHETQDISLEDTSPNDSVLKRLHDQFLYEPRDFTERLVTIIEQSAIEDAIADKSTFNNSFTTLIKQGCNNAVSLIRGKSFANTENDGSSCSNRISFERSVGLASPVNNDPSVMTTKYNETPSKIRRNPDAPVDTSRLTNPRIYITPGTPINSGPNQPTVEYNDDEEYESEIDESNDIENVASDGEKFNINISTSMVKYRQAQWLQYQARYKPKRRSSSNNTAQVGFYDDLIKKRDKCFEVVKELMDLNEKIVTTSKIKDCNSQQRLSIGFCTTIRVCNEYREFITKNDKTPNKNKTDRTFVSSATVKLTSKKSPHLCTKKRTSIQLSLKKSPTRIKSPGAKLLSSSQRKMLASSVTSKNRRSPTPKSTGTPLVDRTNIRSVAQLRTIFSPTLRARSEYIQLFVFIDFFICVSTCTPVNWRLQVNLSFFLPYCATRTGKRKKNSWE